MAMSMHDIVRNAQRLRIEGRTKRTLSPVDRRYHRAILTCAVNNRCRCKSPLDASAKTSAWSPGHSPKKANGMPPLKLAPEGRTLPRELQLPPGRGVFQRLAKSLYGSSSRDSTSWFVW